MEKNILIVHFNTPRLTECLVKSINKFVKDANIYIFDNSDKQPFTAEFDNVTILDNTKGQIVDFDKILEQYPNRVTDEDPARAFPSFKHTFSIETFMNTISDEPFVLMDSDVLLKKDITPLYDENYMFVAEIARQQVVGFNNIDRVVPYICFINTTMCKQHNIHFFNEKHMRGLTRKEDGGTYDTGTSFLQDAKKYPHKRIKHLDYIVHLQSASWPKECIPNKKPELWLKKHKHLWDNTTTQKRQKPKTNINQSLWALMV